MQCFFDVKKYINSDLMFLWENIYYYLLSQFFVDLNKYKRINYLLDCIEIEEIINIFRVLFFYIGFINIYLIKSINSLIEVIKLSDIKR